MKTLWVAPAYKQLPENYQQVLEALGPLVKKSNHNEQIITKNNSTINFEQSQNHAALRGKGYSLVIYDEMAFADERAWTVLRPTLADHGTGRLVGLTTPNGQGWFYNLFRRAKEDPSEWLTFQASWRCSPHLQEAEMEKLKKELGPTRFAQEMEAVFQSPAGAHFDFTWLEHILCTSIPECFERSCISVDLSKGKSAKSDLQSLCFIGWANNSFWVDCRCGRWPLPTLMQIMKEFYRQYRPNHGFIIENNGEQQLFINDFIESFAPDPCPFVARMNASEEKTLRIDRLGYWFARNEIKVLDNEGGRLLQQQAVEFPMAIPFAQGGLIGDDNIDALVQGIQYLCLSPDDVG